MKHKKKIFISELFHPKSGGGKVVSRNSKIAKSLGYKIILFDRPDALLDKLCYHILGLPIKTLYHLIYSNYTHFWFDRTTYLISFFIRAFKRKSIIISYSHNDEFNYRKNLDNIVGDSINKKLFRLFIYIKQNIQINLSNISLFINKNEMDCNSSKQFFLPPTFSEKNYHPNHKRKKRKIFIYLNNFGPNKFGFEKIHNHLKNSIFKIYVLCRENISLNSYENLNIIEGRDNLNEFLTPGNILIAPNYDSNGFKIKVAEALYHDLITIVPTELYNSLISQGLPKNNLLELQKEEDLDKVIKIAIEKDITLGTYKQFFSLESYNKVITKLKLYDTYS